MGHGTDQRIYIHYAYVLRILYREFTRLVELSAAKRTSCSFFFFFFRNIPFQTKPPPPFFLFPLAKRARALDKSNLGHGRTICVTYYMRLERQSAVLIRGPAKRKNLRPNFGLSLKKKKKSPPRNKKEKYVIGSTRDGQLGRLGAGRS